MTPAEEQWMGDATLVHKFRRIAHQYRNHGDMTE